MVTNPLSTDDRRSRITSIFQSIMKTQFPTPYADKRSIPNIKTNNEECKALSEEFRKQIHVRIATIETLVGTKAFELGRRGASKHYIFQDMLLKLDRDIGYFNNKFKDLQKTYKEFLEWLDTYGDEVLTLEVQLRLEKDCKQGCVNCVSSKGSFKVTKRQLHWTDSESIDQLVTALGPQTSHRPCHDPRAVKGITKRLEECFGDAISCLQNSRWIDPTFIPQWQTPKISRYVSIIEEQNWKLLEKFKTADPTPDLEAFINVAGQRCERVLRKFRIDCEVNIHSAFMARGALIAWLQFMYREFSEFLIAYPDVILEDEDLVTRTSNPPNKSRKLDGATRKAHSDQITGMSSGISRKFLDGKVIYKKAPTRGQFWRTKFLKSLAEPEQVYDSLMGSTRRIAKRKYEKYTGKYKEIYMSPDDFEELNLPPQYQKIDTGIPLLDFNGNTVKRRCKNTKQKAKSEVEARLTLLTKYVIDLKPKFRGLRHMKGMSRAVHSKKEEVEAAAKSSRKRKRTEDDSDDDSDDDDDNDDDNDDDYVDEWRG